MKRCILAAIGLCIAAGTANATTVLPNTTVAFSLFDLSTQGVLVTAETARGFSTGQGFRYDRRGAVYRNIFGTLDLYYQIARGGAGSVADDAITAFNASPFRDFMVDAFSIATDPDGAGGFTAASNPGLDTSTVSRDAMLGNLTTSLGSNSLIGTDVSATYIFRTNAPAMTVGVYNLFGPNDRDSVFLPFFAPTGAPVTAVPEISGWAAMILGLGVVGYIMRRRRGRSALAPTTAHR